MSDICKSSDPVANAADHIIENYLTMSCSAARFKAIGT
jgi:hypothetical protein